MKIGSLKLAFKRAYAAMDVSADPDARLGLVRHVQWAVLVLIAFVLLLVSSYALPSGIGAAVRTGLPLASGLALITAATRWSWQTGKRLHTDLDRDAQGLTLFTQLRIGAGFRISTLPYLQRAVVLKFLLLLTPEGFVQHTVTHEVSFVAPERGFIRFSWWRARFVTWRLYRLMFHWRAWHRRDDLLAELAATRRAFREMEPPGRRQYQLLFAGSVEADAATARMSSSRSPRR